MAEQKPFTPGKKKDDKKGAKAPSSKPGASSAKKSATKGKAPAKRK